jgi:hypothetical protein
MLKEFTNVTQPKDGYRRVFGDDFFDLYVWYPEKGGRIIGFELCYDRNGDPHSIIWKEGGGYLHSKIDDGEGRPGRSKKTPILVADGLFNNQEIAGKFRFHGRKIAKEITDLVYGKLSEYLKSRENPFL